MTVIPITEFPNPTLEDLTSIGNADSHIRCCVIEPPKFLCGAPYHPECDVEAPEINCASCRRIQRSCICPKGHHHCPLDLGRFPICPSKEKS